MREVSAEIFLNIHNNDIEILVGAKFKIICLLNVVVVSKVCKYISYCVSVCSKISLNNLTLVLERKTLKCFCTSARRRNRFLFGLLFIL